MKATSSFIIFSISCANLANVNALYENKNEYFSSFAHIEKLQKQEYRVIEEFKKIVKQQEDNLNNIKSFLQDVKNKNQGEKSLQNPIAQYELIRRMVKDWPSLTKNNDFDKKMNDMFEEVNKFHDLPGKRI